jgi:glycosyltransferase involved in cell wall biosynthesis
MRIVADLQSCQNGSRFRGIGRYAMAITKALIALGSDHDFRIFLSDRYPETIPEIRRQFEGILPQESISVLSLFEGTVATDPNNAWRNRAAEIVRREFIAKLKPDLLFVPALFEGLWDKAVVSVEEAPFPTVVTLHDLIPLEDTKLYAPQEPDRDAYIRKLRDARRADLLICISAFVAGEAAEVIGVDPAKLLTVLNGVDPGFCAPKGKIDRTDLMRRMGISRPFVFNTSPFELRKNLHGLIAGFGSMRRDVREAHQIVIAGGMDANALGALAELIRGEGLPADTLVLPGRVSDDDLIALYSECALFAFPSLSEGFGLPPLEAMACGAPVIVSTATSLPEVVDRADLLVDPLDIGAIGAGMERILTDATLEAELRAYGPTRARQFSWDKAARAVLDSFESLHRKHRRKVRSAIAAADRPRLAFVCPTLDWDSHLAARSTALVTRLSNTCEITLVCPESDMQEGWARAHAEIRDIDWLYWNASRFDAIVYATDRFADDAFARLMADLPGILLLLDGIDQPPVGNAPDRTMSWPVQRALYAQGGLGALADAVTSRSGAQQPAELIGADLVLSAQVTLREADDGLPLLPLFRSEQAADALREQLGVSADVRLVVAIADSDGAATRLMNQFRASAAQERAASLILYAAEDADADDADGGALQLTGGVHRLIGPLRTRYRSLLSAADLLLVSADVSSTLRARLEADAEALEIAAIFDADQDQGLADKIVDRLPSRVGRPARPKPVAVSVADPGVAAWADRIADAVARLRSQPPSQMAAVEAALPGSVRGIRADADDIGHLAVSLIANAAIERQPACFLDLTAYVGAGRRVDPLAKSLLIALLRRGGSGIKAVIQDDAQFVIANQFIGALLGLDDFLLSDEALVPRPGDRIVGLGLFHSFAPGTFPALQAAHARGAALLYFADEEALLEGGHEDGIADLLFTWIEEAKSSAHSKIAVLQPASPEAPRDRRLTAFISDVLEADLPIEMLAFEGLAETDFEPAAGRSIEAIAPSEAVRTMWANLSASRRSPAAAPADDAINFAVMGHLIGSYSLAMINRTVARTLEQWRPGHVRFLPYETIPISHTEGVPAGEKALMAELSARPAPKGSEEIVICQHWPVMVPKIRHRLALSLFPWEESHVPMSIVETLNGGFDAIIAPSRSVADALTLSGTKLPVATIGQPVELGQFRALAEERAARTPIRRFLHVSSCFERKGADVLLEAWAKAFTASDDVTLVLKTFPNPHNHIEAQVAELRARHPRLARIEIVNRDAEYEEMPDFFAAADAMVLPTRGEGYNLPALEAMASGLPLIVTGHGGHHDFCGPEQARMIAYRFTRSTSHVAADHAMWAEPDVDDLALALREYADPANADVIEARRRSALAAAVAEGDNRAWTRRLHGVVNDLLADADLSAPRIGWVSTWQVTCGIAQYSANLIERMSSATRRRMTILCDYRTSSSQGEIAHDSAWKVMEGDAGDIATGVRRNDVEAVLIQHQDGLVPWEQLGRLGHDRALRNLVTVVILHNVRTLLWKVQSEDMPGVISGLGKMTRVLVHNVEDLNLLLEMGLDRNTGLFPHGAIAPTQSPWPRTIKSSDAPIIGCHGFFFRHKGIDKLIRAAALLRREWPGLRLRLVNARFPGPEHDEVIKECRAVAREVDMEDAIEWHLDFLAVDQVERLLSECDMIVLPYDESDDSASGAVRTALATMVPLVATRVKIFGDLDAAVGWADSNDPEVLAGAIAPLLRSPEKRREIQAGMHAWLSAHDWQRMATTLENMLHSLVRQKRLGWITSRSDLN